MSEQSPWGSPPPSGPYGSTPPPTPPPSTPPPGYGGPPPPPRRRRTALVLGVVAAVLVVVAAFVVTLVVTRGDDDAPDEATDTSSAVESTAPTEGGETPSETTSESPSDDPSAEPSEEGSGDPAPGDAVAGDGYTYELPAQGWKEASTEARELAATIDTAIILGASIDLSQSSIIVEALTAGPATSVDELEGLWKRNLSSTDNATPTDIDETTIDGERAIGVRIEDRVNNAGAPITQIAYLALHDGKQYSIGLSFPQSGDVTSEADFEQVLASWSWTS